MISLVASKHVTTTPTMELGQLTVPLLILKVQKLWKILGMMPIENMVLSRLS